MTRDRTLRNESIRTFKGETVFDWETEPSNLRPSELAEPTQYGALLASKTRSAYGGLETARPRPPRKRGGGLGNAWVALILALLLGAIAIGALVQFRPLVEGVLLPRTTGHG